MNHSWGRLRIALALACAGTVVLMAAAGIAAEPKEGGAPAAKAAGFKLQRHAIRDKQQGDLVLGTVAAPAGWRLQSDVQWRYEDVSHPVRGRARIEAPDGSAWVEYFPLEIFYWLEPVPAPVAIGGRSLGMIHRPHIEVREAIEQFVVRPNRGRVADLRIEASRQVPDLAKVFRVREVAGDSLMLRLRYRDGGRDVEEEVYGMLVRPNRIPYTGPQGTWYETHRPLLFVHAIGAKGVSLDSVRPLLGFIAGSLDIDPAWEAHRAKVAADLAERFQAYIAAGYAQIQAAAELSRSISANNDALLASMQAQRQAQSARDAARRAASASARSSSDDFSLYLRGTERMEDPYWGESEQSYHQRHHWTDGHGNYRSSDDPTFDPNVGAGGGVTWQRMEPAAR